MSSTPKRPAKTAAEVALETRQRSLLDKEIEESEERFKLLARGKLGRSSLLSGAPRTQLEAATGGTRGGGGGAGSLLSRPAGPAGGVSSGGGRRSAGLSSK